MVLINSPSAGNYTIRITAPASVNNGLFRYGLILSGQSALFVNASFNNLTMNAVYSDQNALFIENNGAAFTQAAYEEAVKSELNNKGLSGLGLKIVAELSEKINSNIHFSSNEDFTTSAQIRF